MKCKRCGKQTHTLSMSYFNTDMCCLDCLVKEKQHPMYKIAKDKEHEEVVKGNMNYEGIGLPSNFYRRDDK